MSLVFSDEAWEDYCYWQKNNKKIVTRINSLIKDIQRNKHRGIGKPEPLRFNWAGYWSRRIDSEHRLVYKVEQGQILIAQCRYHY
ncbi:MAG: Txe/YoeB family addiction module toxin [Myxococcota bacterium]|nr:Txe/YoeB family addiction module toxin [Myxococcota bacterium]